MFWLVEGTKTNVFLDENDRFIFWVFFNSVDNKKYSIASITYELGIHTGKRKNRFMLYSVALLKPMEKLLLTGKKESREKRIL